MLQRRMNSRVLFQCARAAAWMLLATAAGCSSSGGTTAPTAATPVLTTLAVTLSEPTLFVGGTTTARVTGADQNGQAMSVIGVVWSTSNQSIATVTAGGVVRGVAAGTSQVIATFGGVSGSALLTVLVLVPGAMTR